MVCRVCGGDGGCQACKGSGKSGFHLHHPGAFAKRCWRCEGSGHCAQCQGFGEIEEPAFQPYIYVYAERTRPTSIAMAAVSGAPWRYIEIPHRILSRGQEQQRAWVSWCVRTHYLRSHKELTLFGRILSYGWRLADGSTIRFDTQGRVVK
jgi:hypothetical protein